VAVAAATASASAAPLAECAPRVHYEKLEATAAAAGVQLSHLIVGLCAAPEPHCVLLADCKPNEDSLVVRVSLEKQCVEQCLTRVTDGIVTALSPTATAATLALLIAKLEGNQIRRFLRLLTRESDTWRTAHDATTHTTADWNPFNGLCTSRGLLLCAALSVSRRLVALAVTSDSQLRPAGEKEFDSMIYGLCAFASSGEQLVATTHFDRTVRLWRHLAAAAQSAALALEQCCRVTADREVFRLLLLESCSIRGFSLCLTMLVGRVRESAILRDRAAEGSNDGPRGRSEGVESKLSIDPKAHWGWTQRLNGEAEQDS